MAFWTTNQGNLVNQINSKNLRNCQRYLHNISFNLENDIWVKTEIWNTAKTYIISSSLNPQINDKDLIHIPRGLNISYTQNSIILKGLIEDVDTYHPSLINYIWSGFNVTSDMFKNENSLEKATIEDVKTQHAHYTGKFWGSRGIQGWYRDSKTLSFSFVAKVYYRINEQNQSTQTTNSTNTNTLRNQTTASTKNTNSKNTQVTPPLLVLESNFQIQIVPNYDPSYFCRRYCEGNPKLNYNEYLEKIRALGLDFLVIDRSDPNA